MIIHFVRHGQTEVGADGLYVPNAGLTSFGQKQAAQVAARIAELNPDASYTSNLPRAVETAKHYTRVSGQPVEQRPALNELNTGDIWSAPTAVKKLIAQANYEVDYKSMGGESLDEFSTRVRAGFEDVLIEVQRLQYRSIAAFLHEGVINVILDNLEGFTSYVSNRRIPMPNCAIITVDTNLKPPYFDGDWETLHLDELSS